MASMAVWGAQRLLAPSPLSASRRPAAFVNQAAFQEMPVFRLIQASSGQFMPVQASSGQFSSG
jgi:hypothetical protein